MRDRQRDGILKSGREQAAADSEGREPVCVLSPSASGGTRQ